MLIAVLVAAIASAILGGMAGGPDVFEETVKDWKRGIRKHESDPKRQEAALLIVEAFKRLVAQMSSRVDTNMGQLAVVNARYDAKLEELVAVVDGLAADILAVQLEMIGLGAQLRAALSPEAFATIRANVTKEAEKRETKRKKAAAKAEKRKQRKEAK